MMSYLESNIGLVVKKVGLLKTIIKKIDLEKKPIAFISMIVLIESLWWLSQYIREAYEHTDRKGHPQIA